MTQSSKESDIAEQALDAVSDALSDAGLTPERTANIHGEDLLVQTSHEQRMDASRFWVQVEGTDEIVGYRLDSGGFRHSIPFDQAMRWVRTLDLVVIVLWDVAADVGWYAIPTSQVDAVEGVNAGQKSITIRFAESDALTKEAVNRLAWISRLKHYELLALSARDAQSVRKRTGKKHAHDRVLAVLDFTDLLGITERQREPGGMKYGVREEAWDELQEVLDSTPGVKGESRQDLTRRVAYAFVRRKWGMIEPKLDLPKALVEEGAVVILDKFRNIENDPKAMKEAEAWGLRHSEGR